MIRALCSFLLVGSLAVALVCADEIAVVNEFKQFAEQENARFRATFDALAGTFLEDPVGVPMPLSLPRKYQFSGVQLEAAPATYSYDVRRTDSLVTPYVGQLEWPLVLLKVTTHAKGPAEHCNRQPLKKCLENGGKIVETAMLYKNSAVRVPKSMRYEYVYQEGQWKPKKEWKTVLAELVASLNLEKPVTPSSVPSILGLPTPPPQQPYAEAPDEP